MRPNLRNSNLTKIFYSRDSRQALNKINRILSSERNFIDSNRLQDEIGEAYFLGKVSVIKHSRLASQDSASYSNAALTSQRSSSPMVLAPIKLPSTRRNRTRKRQLTCAEAQVLHSKQTRRNLERAKRFDSVKAICSTFDSGKESFSNMRRVAKASSIFKQEIGRTAEDLALVSGLDQEMLVEAYGKLKLDRQTLEEDFMNAFEDFKANLSNPKRALPRLEISKRHG